MLSMTESSGKCRRRQQQRRCIGAQVGREFRPESEPGLHLILALKHEGDGVAAVLSLHGDDVIVAGALEHLGHVVEVHAHAEGAVAPEVVEAVRAQHEGHEGDMGRVHGLEAEPGRGAIKVGICHQILDGLQHLLQQSACSSHHPRSDPAAPFAIQQTDSSLLPTGMLVWLCCEGTT